MYDDGFHLITNVDFSEVVIEAMKKKNSTRYRDLCNLQVFTWCKDWNELPIDGHA